METNLRCLNARQSMEKNLIAACQVPDVNIDHVVMVVDRLLSEYEASIHGPTNWQMLSSFLRKREQVQLIGGEMLLFIQIAESLRQESLEWKIKHEELLTKKMQIMTKLMQKLMLSEGSKLMERHDVAVRDAKASLQKAAIIEERLNALRIEFSSSLAVKEEEIKNKVAKLVSAEQCLTNLSLELKVTFCLLFLFSFFGF
ncbi:hypothetical protein CRYUN_Cryun04dG0113600 [Craigia yunnanensis]